jgi:hypothetical protein
MIPPTDREFPIVKLNTLTLESLTPPTVTSKTWRVMEHTIRGGDYRGGGSVILGSLPSGIRRLWIVFLGYLKPLSLASLVRSFFGNQVRARFARLFRKVNPYDVHDTIPSPGIPFTLPGDLRGSRGSHALFQACTRVGFDDHGFASVDSCVAPIATARIFQISDQTRPDIQYADEIEVDTRALMIVR